MAEQVFLKEATKATLNKLISLAAGEIGLVWSFKPMVRRLGKRFQQAQNLLSDAADNPNLMGKKTVQDWLKDLNAAASDAEDVLDEIAFELLRRKLEVENRRIRIGSKVRNFFSLSNPLPFRLGMGHKINNINLLFDQIYKQANEIGLRAVDVINPTTERTDTRKTHPVVDDSSVVGRQGDVSKVVEMLLCSDDDDRDLPVISIVGMAGLGKTTIAQLVYKDEKVVMNFGERMWVGVSKDFNIERLLNEMVQSVTGTNCEMSNIEAMIKKLHDHLNGKSYLLVLDDVWNENHEKWEQMRNSLLGIGGARGSKVVVTTRSVAVVSTMQGPSAVTHHLVPLSENDSWTLFKQRAFAEGGPVQSSDLMAVGERLVRRCGGLPLAIKVLGALMHSKKNENEWMLIERSEIWNLLDVLPSLRLSFEHLPSPSLKQCFAYCSIIPKHSTIVKDVIVQLWMAQGFLEPPQGSNLEMEDLGNEYFDILLWNSLFQDAKKDKYGNIICCTMHDLVYELAVSVSKDYCLATKTGMLNDDSRIQHLCLVGNINVKVQISKRSSQKLRTLISYGVNFGNSLNEFKCLRTLDLFRSKIEELPISISKLIHLRNIDISYNPIKALPNSITGLYNLQKLSILNCVHLERLPSEFKNLVSLRHFYMDDDKKRRNLMPTGMGQLTCLQSLPFFVVGQDKGRRMEELGCLHNLKGALKVYRLEHVTSKNDAEQGNLSSKCNLHELKFHWSSEREVDPVRDMEVLEGLKPHRNLKGLTIENFGGGRLASWIVMNDNLLLCGLVELKLKNCKRLDSIPALGHLPYLKVLAIEGIHSVKCINFTFYGVTCDRREATPAFPSLRDLSLIDMPNLVEWSELAHPGLSCPVFPCLEMLRIEGCPQLSIIPTNFPCMKKLVVIEINSMALLKMSSKLTSLHSLEIVKASGQEVDSVIKELLKNNASLLKALEIRECEELSCLPKELLGLAALEMLIVQGCPNLTLLPEIEETDSLTTCLRRFDIHNCEKLSYLPNGLRNLKSLEYLFIMWCPNLNLMSIINNDQSNGDIGCLPSLQWLSIAGCGTSLSRGCCDNWPGWVFSLTHLRTLAIGWFREELDYFPWPSVTTAATTTNSSSTNSQKLPTPLALPLPLHLHFRSLVSLDLLGWQKLTSLPNQLQHFTSLTTLSIYGFRGLIALPDWLGDLSSLKNLWLACCDILRNLPSGEAMRRLSNLSYLAMTTCPILSERCKRGSGSEWYKIAHIPSIRIDHEYIQRK